MADRIAITGVGPVSAIGIGPEEFAAALREGKRGIAEVTAFDVETCRNRRAAEIIDFDVNGYIETEKNYLDRNSEFAFAAAKLALEDSGFATGDDVAPRLGICMGTAYGNMDTSHSFYDSLVQKGAKLVSPFLFQHTYNNTTISLLAIEYSMRGVHANFCSGLAAGAEAILYAADSLRFGRADAILAGGAEALSEAVFKGTDSLGGDMTPGEGAALLMLEPERRAKSRGAAIRALIMGGGSGGDIKTATELALGEAGIREGEIDLVFGPASNPKLPNFRIEEMIGHTLGASGALAVAAAVLAMGKGFIPGKGEGKLEHTLVNSTDPSGLNVSLVLGKG